MTTLVTELAAGHLSGSVKERQLL